MLASSELRISASEPVRVKTSPVVIARASTSRLPVVLVPKFTARAPTSAVVTLTRPVPVKVLSRLTVLSAPVTLMLPLPAPLNVSAPAVPEAASPSTVSTPAPSFWIEVAAVPISKVAAAAFVTVAVTAPA